MIHDDKLRSSVTNFESSRLDNKISEFISVVVFEYEPQLKRTENLHGSLSKILGYADLPPDADFIPLVHPDDLKIPVHALEHIISRGNEGNYCFECRLISASREERFFRFNGRLSATLPNNRIMFIGEDVTDIINSVRRRFEEQHANHLEKIKELEKENKTLEEFSSLAIRGIKEPLNRFASITVSLNQRINGFRNPEWWSYVREVESFNHRMDVLLESINEYSRVNQKIRLYEKAGLAELLNQVKFQMRSELDAVSAKLVVEELPALPVVAVQIRQLFAQLISNSIKFRKPEIEPEIRVRSAVLPFSMYEKLGLTTSRTYYKIIVSDNGQGFPAGDNERIFLPFYKGKTEDNNESAGIGLAICRRIIDHHHGKIFADSEPGLGAIITFILPDKH